MLFKNKEFQYKFKSITVLNSFDFKFDNNDI
jgi:hypothetical protein